MITYLTPAPCDEMRGVIYINGKKRQCTGIGLKFFADAEGFAGMKCSFHSLTHEAVSLLKSGVAVKVNGNVYSLHPTKEK